MKNYFWLFLLLGMFASCSSEDVIENVINGTEKNPVQSRTAVVSWPYYRLSVEVSEVIDEFYTDTYERYHYKYSNTLHFYTDSSCKEKAVLANPASVRYTIYRYTKVADLPNPMEQSFTSVVQIPAGVESYTICTTETNMEMTLGNETGTWETCVVESFSIN